MPSALAPSLPTGTGALPNETGVLPTETAVLLNANARRVSERTRRAVRRMVPSENLFFTHSLEEARRAGEEILARGYRQVVAGGGDGTVALLLDSLCRAAEADACAGDDLSLPAIRVLRLGTGNALASHVGAGSLGRDLARLMEGRGVCELPLHLIESAGRLSFFAGTGADAMIVNDYAAMKRRLRRVVPGRLAEGVLAYFVAAFGKTIPRVLSHGRATVRIINLGRPAVRLGPGGRVVGDPIGKGEVLYEGPSLMTSAGTLPYYGFGMRMFPWACDRSGFMQLRVCDAPVSSVVNHIPDIFSGTYDHARLFDFHVTHVRLEFDREAPVHVAGDAEGWRRELELAVSPHTVPIVHLN